jgi:hypothetical protein
MSAKKNLCIVFLQTDGRDEGVWPVLQGREPQRSKPEALANAAKFTAAALDTRLHRLTHKRQ